MRVSRDRERDGGDSHERRERGRRRYPDRDRQVFDAARIRVLDHGKPRLDREASGTLISLRLGKSVPRKFMRPEALWRCCRLPAAALVNTLAYPDGRTDRAAG